MIHPIHWFHEQQIHRRRVRVLADWIADRLPRNASVLDVGCGDGELASELLKRRPDTQIQGIDVLVRGETAIPVQEFDGSHFPLGDADVDVVIMIDVLHHTDTPLRLLQESTRVARKHVLIKDHFLQGIAAYRTLAFMDHVGNSRHGVAIPCNYLTPEKWTELFDRAKLQPTEMVEHLGLYPWPLSCFFERRLHFLTLLNREVNA